MSYTALAVLGAALVVALDVVVLRTRLVARRSFWVSYAIVLFFQFIVNGMLTGFKIVRYDERAIVGWRLFWAPVEDVLFGFAMVTLTLSVWVALGRPRGRALTHERLRD
jgi:lycopene cyclase domain-containing protein